MKTTLLDFTNIPNDNKINIEEDSRILGIFVGRKSDNLSLNLDIIHKKPNINSEILIKSILFDKSTFDFTGNLIIQKGAKNTDTYLKADVLMMSPEAKARAVPSLEIMETDVKGGHGATVGRIDLNSLFYLQSRGISESESIGILAEAFVEDIFDDIDSPIYKNKIRKKIKAALKSINKVKKGNRYS